MKCYYCSDEAVFSQVPGIAVCNYHRTQTEQTDRAPNQFLEDPELLVIEQCVSQIDGLPIPVRSRVIRYLKDRFEA